MLHSLRVFTLISVIGLAASVLMSCSSNNEKETSIATRTPQVASPSETASGAKSADQQTSAVPHKEDPVKDKDLTEPAQGDTHEAATKPITATQPLSPPSHETPNNKATIPIVNPPTSPNPPNGAINDWVAALCGEIGKKLGSVSVENCLNSALRDSGGRSIQNRAIAVKEFTTLGNKQPLGRVMLMGGIHGDEYSSVSIVFKWLETLNHHHSGLFEWMVVPLLNPDGLLRKQSQRQNHAGVDLNRNFPTPDWNANALKYWRNRTYRNPRRYPGPVASSEPETQWFIQQIAAFKPDAIVAVHAPHSLVDYDGPQKPPHKLGRLYLRELGIYPGSLGNYAGVANNIPVVTIELSSAGIMPSNQEINSMWNDLVAWLQREVPKQRLARSQSDKTE